MKKRLGLFTALTTLVVAAMLFVSCGQNSAIAGSISLNASELTRQLMSRDVAEGDGTSAPLTYEGFRALLEQELKKVMDKHFTANVSLTLSGDYNGTGTQQITPSMFAKSDHHAASGENDDEEDDVKIELKRIPVGSTVEVQVELSFAIDNQYESEMNKAIENLLASYPEFSGMKESLMYEMNYVFSADRYRKLKYEGKTAEPVTIKAGKNPVTIEMEQTDGFAAEGYFEFDFDSYDSTPLILDVKVIQYDKYDVYLDSSEYGWVIDRVIVDRGEDHRIVLPGNNNITLGTLIFDLDNQVYGNKLVISVGESTIEDVIQEQGITILIIAKSEYTGKYRTAVFSGIRGD